MSTALAPGRPAWNARSCVGRVGLHGGKLEGWCFYPDRPRQRAIVDLHVDGVRRHVASAARPRTDLRSLGLGDGHFGFSVPLDTPELAVGGGCVIEVTERRFDQLLGRVAVGAGGVLAQLGERLDRSEAALREVSRELTAACRRPRHDLGGLLGELGGALLAGYRDRSARRADRAAPGIGFGRARLADIAATVLPWHERPGFSLVVLPGPDIGAVARAIRWAAAALAGLPVEVILLDDGAQPLACLLPTRIRHLQLVRADRRSDYGGFVNAGVLAARGDWVGIVAADRLQPAGLRDAFTTRQDGALHLERRARLDGLSGDGTAPPAAVWHGGLRCLVSRDAYRALGGLDRAIDEQLAWDGLAEKAAALGMAVRPWHRPRPFQLAAAAVPH